MRSPFLTALVHPVNVGMFGLALFAGLFAAWWLFPLGLVFWLVMVLRISRDDSLRFTYRMQSREPLAQRFQEYFDRVERSQLSVFNNLSVASPQIRRALSPVQEAVDKVTAQVYSLCQKMTSLENYRRVTEAGRDLQADLARINASMRRTSDETIRQEYQASKRSIEERLNKLKSVSLLLDRVEAQLMGLAHDLDGVMTEVIRLQAMAPENAARHAPAIVQRLEKQSAEIEAFEREITQV